MRYPYRRDLRFITAQDGTRVAYHWHLRDPAAPPARGRPVLLTNGIGTTENFWRYLVGALSETRQVVHWDYRGHGHSETSLSGAYDLRTQARDLVAVTAQVERQVGVAPLHLAFSMGVAVLLEAYRDEPSRFPAIVLLAGAPDAPFATTFPLSLPGALPLLRAAVGALTPAVPLVAPFLRAALRSPLVYPAGRALKLLRKRAPREDIRLFMDGLSRMEPRAYLETLKGLLRAQASDVLPTVQVPTLILAAENDLLMPRTQVERMRRAVPHARYALIEDAGHAGLLEAGPELAQHVRRFFDEVDG